LSYTDFDGDSHCLFKGTYDVYDALDSTFSIPNYKESNDRKISE
jgi:hypothetical protein